MKDLYSHLTQIAEFTLNIIDELLSKEMSKHYTRKIYKALDPTNVRTTDDVHSALKLITILERDEYRYLSLDEQEDLMSALALSQYVFMTIGQLQTIYTTVERQKGFMQILSKRIALRNISKAGTN